MSFLDKIKASSAGGLKPAGEPQDKAGAVSKLKPGVADSLAGEADDFIADLDPYLPTEIVGGSIPHIVGTEEEAVWNAASQACGTEKVHFVYTIEDKRCWYIACPSYALASDPDSWCPLAAALPGNSEFWDKETVYLYEQEGMASALRWDPDTGRMQVFIGAARTLLPRIQSMDANFVTINADVADVAPWRNRNLKTEKLSRASARMLLVVGIAANIFILAILIGQFLYTNMVQRDLVKVKRDSDRAAQEILMKAYNALQSDTIKHMVRIQDLLDELRLVGGTLVKYEVKSGKLTWEALIPQTYTGTIGKTKTDVLPVPEKDGRARIRGYK